MTNCYLSLVIPVFNEENCIEKTLKRTIDYLSSKNFIYEIIVADDGSTDKTEEIVERFAKNHSNSTIKFVTHNIHKGKGFAVNTGMKSSVGEYSLFLDADLSTDIKELEKLISYMQEGTDIVIGSRRIAGAKVEIHQPVIREFMGRVFTWLSNLFLGTEFSGFTCGFKCFSKKAKERIFSLQKITNWSYDAEILFLAKKLGYRIKEIPIVWRNDPTTKVNLFRDTIVSFIGLIRIRLIHRNFNKFLS